MEYSFSLDFEKIRKITQVKDIQSLECYLNYVFNDLNSRENNTRDEKYIEKITFIEYMNIPYIVGEKLFKILNKSKNGFLNKQEFVSGIISLYSGSLEETEEMIFNLLDFDLDGVIIPEDTRLLLTFLKNLAISNKNTNTIQLKKMKTNTITDEEEFKAIDNFVNSFFKGKSNIDFEEFKQYIEKENSDIFLLFMYFLYNNKPFHDNSVKFLKVRINDFPKGQNLSANNLKIIECDVSCSMDPMNESNSNLRKKLISPSKSFGELVEEITYVDIEELSNCSDLENLDDLDDLTFSTMENVKIKEIPAFKRSSTTLDYNKNDSDYIKKNTKNLEIFGPVNIQISKDNFMRRKTFINVLSLSNNSRGNSRGSRNSLSYQNSEFDNNSNGDNNSNNNIPIKRNSVNSNNFNKENRKRSNYLHREYSYNNTYNDHKGNSSDENSNSHMGKNNQNPKRNFSDKNCRKKFQENVLDKKRTEVNRCITYNNSLSENMPQINIFVENKNNNQNAKKNFNKTNIQSKNSLSILTHNSPVPTRKNSNKKIDDCIEFESYIYRAEDNNQLKKYFTALIGTDLCFFTNSKKVRLKGLHNLSGTYVFKDACPIKVRKEKPANICKKKILKKFIYLKIFKSY